MKNYKVFPLFLLLTILLPGCLFKKDGIEVTKKKSKKVALVDKGVGIPSGGLSERGKCFDDEVELYVLEEESSPFDHTEEMKIARADIEQEEREWQKDSALGERHFEPVYFGFDKHNIDEDQKATVAFDAEQAKEVLKNDGILALEGHSDSHFVSEAYNIAKSEQRARTIAEELEKSGIERSKIKVIGYGDKRKAVDVSGKEQKNRRVEFVTLTEVA
ncbi:OmpA family protein [Candidatus Babeliales bacterium]|nr:OmpA family protein [Candidatus Babeliales bacterium]